MKSKKYKQIDTQWTPQNKQKRILKDLWSYMQNEITW
jgi:hypothetical protein